MTNEERHEARRKRRMKRRELKRLAYNEKFDNFDNVTSLEYLIHSAYMSRKGVNKKASVQKYMMSLMRNATDSRSALLAHSDVRQGFIRFTLNERGKTRHIRAMHVKERVIQRCLCDYVLVPIFKRSLVYDNGASLKGKGIHFALFRLKKMLQKYVRKHGTNGYILLVDFSGYFDNILHLPIWNMLKENISDEELRLLTWKFVKAFGVKSLGIGSQVSQILAIAYPSRVDHRIKEFHQNGMSARYMDDTYIISSSKEELDAILEDCVKEWRKLGIIVSESKTRVYPISRFTFMKVRYRITPTGKVLMLPCKKSFTRMRRKLRAFRQLLNDGLIKTEQIICAYQSWRGYQNHFNSYRLLNRMDIYYRNLFERTETV